MKLRNVLFLAVLAIVGVLTFEAVAPAADVGIDWSRLLMAGLFVFLAGNLLSRVPANGALFATLTTTEILADTLDAFRTFVPMISAFSTDFSNARSKKGEQIMAHVSTLPSVQDWDANSGMELNQVEADALITDVPVTLNQFKHVPVRVKALTQLASRKDLYLEAIRNIAYVLGKYVVDYVLSLVTAANVTNQKIASTLNTSMDTLELLRTTLNTQKAASVGRFGLISSACGGAIQADPRASNSQYYGQLNGGNAYRHYVNMAGFSNIWEYPDFPANGINLSGFFGDRRAAVIASRLPSDIEDLADEAGVPKIANFETLTDDQSGLSMMAIAYQKQGTFDIWLTIALLFGASVGAQGGGAAAKTDSAGIRLRTA
jgi:hypothetical protein